MDDVVEYTEPGMLSFTTVKPVQTCSTVQSRLPETDTAMNRPLCHCSETHKEDIAQPAQFWETAQPDFPDWTVQWWAGEVRLQELEYDLDAAYTMHLRDDRVPELRRHLLKLEAYDSVGNPQVLHIDMHNFCLQVTEGRAAFFDLSSDFYQPISIRRVEVPNQY